MENRINITHLPIELIGMIGESETDIVPGLSCVNRFFHDGLSRIRKKRQEQREQINRNLKGKKHTDRFYSCESLPIPEAIIIWEEEDLIIASSMKKMWAWEKKQRSVVWEQNRESSSNREWGSNLLGSFLPNFALIDGKLICPLTRVTEYQSVHMLILDAKTGKELNHFQHEDLISESLITVEDSIILKHRNGMIYHYDINFKEKQSFQSEKCVGQTTCLLATPAYTVDINKNKISIFYRIENKPLKTITIEDVAISAAYINKDQLVCGFTKGYINNLMLIDLTKGEIAYQGDGDFLQGGKINAIIMKNKYIFFIRNGSLCYQNLRDNKLGFLEKISDKPGDRQSLSIQDNYLFVKNHNEINKIGFVSIFDLELMEKESMEKKPIEKKSMEEVTRMVGYVVNFAIWREGCLFINKERNLLMHDFTSQELTLENVSRRSTF